MNRTGARLAHWLNVCLGFFYPEQCQLCRAEPAGPGDGYVGSRCRAQLRFIRPPYCRRCGLPLEGDVTTPFECANCREMEFAFSSARSAVAARGVVLEAIHRYKYRRAVWFEPFLASVLIQKAAPELRRERWDGIVPVPLHPVRQREREFNQAERLGARLGAALQIPVHRRLLRRTVATRTQTLLTRGERAANVRGAFQLRKRRSLDGLRLVLVDDVFTTGATTSACAGVLRKAGASAVCVWTVARGL